MSKLTATFKKFLRELYAYDNIKQSYTELGVTNANDAYNKLFKEFQVLEKQEQKRASKEKATEWVKNIKQKVVNKEKAKKEKKVSKEVAYENTIIINRNNIDDYDWKVIRIELNKMKKKLKQLKLYKEPLLFQQQIYFYDDNGRLLNKVYQKKEERPIRDKYGNVIDTRIVIVQYDFTKKMFEFNKITNEMIEKIQLHMNANGSHSEWLPYALIDLFHENGYTKIITKALKAIQPKSSKQVYKQAETGTCVYDGCVKYFEKQIDYNRNAKAIYNKLINGKEEYATSYTDEEIKNKLAPLCKASISINNLITGKNKSFNENSNNRFHISFMNTKYNHLDLLTHSYEEVVEVEKEEYNNIKNSSKFWIEKYGQLITLDKVYKLKNDMFKVHYNTWKNLNKYDEKFIYQDSKEYDFIQTYDYKLHTFFNKMPIDNDLYTELDLKGAYMNYSDFEYNKHYQGVPTGSFINVKCDDTFTDETFKELTANGLIGFFQIQILDTGFDERLGFTNGSIHTLFTPMVQLVLEHCGIKFLNASYSPSCHMPFSIMGNYKLMAEKDENGLKHYCKAFGLMLSESSTIDIKIKPLKCDMKYFNTFENSDDVYLYKDDDKVKIQYKNKKAKSYIHIGYALHAYTQTLILEQLIKMDLNKVFGVKLDSIVITNEYAEELRNNKWSIYKNKHFDEKKCKVERLLRNQEDEEPEVCNEGEEIIDGFFRKYIVSKSNEYTEFDLPFTQNGEYITDRVVFIGGKGGSGKTYSLMKALPTNCFTTMCWNLIQDKYNFVGHSIPQLIGSNEGDTKFKCELTQDKSFKYLIIDEATLIHEASIKKMIETYENMFIFILGDIDYDGRYYQSSIHKENVFNPSVEECQYIQYTKSYRFDDNLNNKLNGLRENMRMWRGDGYTYVRKHFANCFYKEDDIIMNDNDVGISALDDLKRGNMWTEYFVNKGAKPKYFIKKTNMNNGQMRGQELLEKPDHSNYEMKLFKTIHSFQGLDLNHDNKIVIILNSLFDKNLLYTALSRARREDQIIIIDKLNYA